MPIDPQLIEDERFEAFRAFRESLSPEQKATLSGLLGEAKPHVYSCTSWGEGQWCCLDFIVVEGEDDQ